MFTSKTNAAGAFKALRSLLLLFVADVALTVGVANAGEQLSDFGSPTQRKSLQDKGDFPQAESHRTEKKDGDKIRRVDFQQDVGSPRDAGQNENGGQPNGELFEPGRVLAMVAGEPIFAGDLLLTINEVIETRAADAPDFVKQKMVDQGIRELLPRAIERKILYHEALSKLPDASKIDEIKKDLYKQLEEKQLPQMFKKYEVTNLGQLDARLRMLGSSWRAVKDQAAEQEIAKFGIMSQVSIDNEISHDQLYAMYLSRREDFQLKNQVRWEHMMVSFAKSPNKAAAKKKLAIMGNEVVNGANFAAVAKRDSDGFLASKGGFVDWTERGSLTNKVLEERIFNEAIGELSDIIESEQGYHIIRVIERQEGGFVPFEEAQDKLREQILDQRQTEAADRILEKIKRRIPYEIFVEGIQY